MSMGRQGEGVREPVVQGQEQGLHQEQDQGQSQERSHEKGNVLVIGNSGVGKSTLINAVLGDKVARTGWGTSGTTKRLDIYEGDNVPFRIIDSMGFEPKLIQNLRAVHSVHKWSKESRDPEEKNRKINVIWFCIDGTSRKLFRDSIRNFSAATAMWKSVPMIVVITKSYSKPDREENIAMVKEAFRGLKREPNIRAVIPVVAQNYIIDEGTIVGPENIGDLIQQTNNIMPEGLKAGDRDLSDFMLKRKRALAQSVVAGSVVAGATVGAVPMPIADTLVLSPLELAMLRALSKIYGIEDGEKSKKFIESIVVAGTASVAARSALSALKAIPGLNVAASMLNAAVAACFVAAIGESAIAAFEQVAAGKHDLNDVEWVSKLTESNLGAQFVADASKVIEKSERTAKARDLPQMLGELVKAVFFASRNSGK